MLTIVLACAAVVTALVLIRRVRSGALEWDMGSLMLFVIGFAYMLPTAAAKFTGSQVYRIGPTGEQTIAGLGWADRLVTLSDYTAVGAAALVLTLSVATRSKIRWSAGAAPLLCIVALATLVSSVKLDAFPTGQPIMLMIVISAAALVRTSKSAVATGATALVLAAVFMSSALALWKPEAAFQECNEKCTFVGQIFTGVSSHGNGLALLVTLGLPFVWLATERKTRYWLIAHLLLIIGISGSRTALATACVVVLVMAVMRVRVSGDRTEGKRAWFGVLAAVAAAGLSLIVGVLPHEDAYTTGRGYLWRIALENFSTSPIVGTGLTTWSELFEDRQFGAAAAYSTHNQWIEVLLFSGIIGAALLALFIIKCLTAADRRLTLAPLLVAVFTLGVFERPLSISLVDALTWAMLGMVMLAGSSATSDEESGPAGKSRKAALPDWALDTKGDLQPWIQSARHRQDSR